MTDTKPFPALSNFDDATLLSELRRRGFAVIIGKVDISSMRDRVVSVAKLEDELEEAMSVARKGRDEAGWPHDIYLGLECAREIVRRLSTEITDS